MKHKITAKKGPNTGTTYTFLPVLYDKALNVMDQENTKVGGGSVARITFEYFPYVFLGDTKKAGLTKRLVALQITDLKEWGETRSGESFGFEKEEDDEAEETATEEADTEDADNEDDSTGGDF